MFQYTLIRSKRKTLELRITNDAVIEVRAPFKMSKVEIDKFVIKKQAWIEKSMHDITTRQQNALFITEEQQLILRQSAEKIIPVRVAFYADIMGVTPTAVKISNATTYWGSCSGKNSLNFSWRLMLGDLYIIDYVIVHELAHIKEHNHSKRFWEIVSEIFPDYDQRRKKLNRMRIIRIGE